MITPSAHAGRLDLSGRRTYDGRVDPYTQRVRRPYRDLPGGSTRVRGVNDLPYNPARPLRLPNEPGPHRRPRLPLGRLFRILVPVSLVAAAGVGIFVLVDTLLDEGDGSTEEAAPAAAETSADQPAGAEQPAAPSVAEPETVGTSEAATPAPAEEGATARIITSVDVGGAPVVVERGAATPVPSGLTGLLLADGSPYDPADVSLAFSSVWQPGTVLEITRLPGGSLLSAENATRLVGQSIRVTVHQTGVFPTELQLSPAAYTQLALPIEPIIALRMEVVDVTAR